MTQRLRFISVVALGLCLPACGRLDDLWNNATRSPASDAGRAGALDPNALPGDDAATPTVVEPLPDPADQDAGSISTAESDAGSQESVDAGADAASSDAPELAADAGPDTRPTITAMAFRTGVVEAPVAGARWVGYIRAGGRIPIVRGPVGNDGCAARRDTAGAGWYEVDGGGFVCVGPLAMLTTQVTGRPFERRLPTPPDPSQAMPFQYAIAYRSAPMYRWLPSLEDEREIEPDRFSPRADTPVDLGLGDAAVANGSRADASAPAARLPDAGPPRIEELEGVAGSPLLRRMTRGMYVSLDRAVRANTGSTFWRTQSGGFVRSGTVSSVRSPPTFQGVRLGEGAGHQLPLAFAISVQASTYQTNGRGGFAPVQRVARLSTFDLTDEAPVTVAGEQYYHTRDGYFIRSRQMRVVTRHEVPSDLSPGEKWIDVNLDHQSVVAYEGANPVYVTVASTGRRNRGNPDENYETVQGGFRIQSKHMATTMDGNSANDGPYSIEDVPWVMYFEQSFALHGAFWHNGFGMMHSHGCVNLAPADARFFFEWSEPRVAPGWHGAYATPQHLGTRVYVHYDAQALGERGGPDRVPSH
ncbi:MAG: L,D-transpeptidase [Myxococcales bacterium]|nr:L,D-transpeptidase [Myxococcales bacterium]